LEDLNKSKVKSKVISGIRLENMERTRLKLNPNNMINKRNTEIKIKEVIINHSIDNKMVKKVLRSLISRKKAQNQ